MDTHHLMSPAVDQIWARLAGCGIFMNCFGEPGS